MVRVKMLKLGAQLGLELGFMLIIGIGLRLNIRGYVGVWDVVRVRVRVKGKVSIRFGGYIRIWDKVRFSVRFRVKVES